VLVDLERLSLGPPTPRNTQRAIDVGIATSTFCSADVESRQELLNVLDAAVKNALCPLSKSAS
jgi:hypothetical protein